MTEREIMEFDIVIVGAGPSGLACSIKLAQLAQDAGKEISICIVEKGSEVGAHILSGNVFEPKALGELIPDWKEKGAPLTTEVKEDNFLYLTEKGSTKLPTPPQMHNHGNYIISLGNLCRWLAEQAEALGVQIFAGFPASEVLYDENENVAGIITGDFGVAEDGSHKESYQAGIEIKAKQTIFAEGARGHLTKRLEKKFNLREGKQPQTYAIGYKEIWQIDPAKHKEGKVTHTIGWPMDSKTYGGSFIYHAENNQVLLGYVIGLDYKNTYLNTFKEFQRFKHHPVVAELLEGAERVTYGARALNEGGFQSIPKLTFPGGMLIGCTAGFLNVPKIKGSHTAIKSGIVAAEAIFDNFEDCTAKELTEYEEKIKDSWIYEELYKIRNIRPSFKFGLWSGLAYSALDTYIFRGKAPWTFKHHKDNEQTKKASECKPIEYPQPDGKISFDILSSVYLTGTYHEEDQPVHLTLVDKNIPVEHNLKYYNGPEARYCPAGVYEYLKNDAGEDALQINSQNCIHCKTCDIKDMTQNINWVNPEGGGGPNYPNM